MSNFRQGDRVRVTGNTDLWHSFPVGSVGYVTYLWSSNRCEVRVDDRNYDYTQTIHNNDLELISEAVQYVIEDGYTLYISTDIPDSADRVWELGRELTKETKWS